MREVYKFIVVSCAAVLVSCGGKGPQIPSQRKGETPKADSTQLALLELNQQLRESADATLLHLVQAQGEPYAQYEMGTWVHMYDVGRTEEDKIQEGEECTVYMRVSSLEGKLYSDTEQRFKAGKYEVPAAIDANIREWYHGAKMRLIAPWYAAYGIKGTAQVPPYENVIIELEIK